MRLCIRPGFYALSSITTLFFIMAAMVITALSPAWSKTNLQHNPKATDGKIYYSIKNLPPRVRKMHREIFTAARSGDLSLMQEVLEINELLPATDQSDITNPIAFWKKQSLDGDAAQILAIMSKILQAGYVKRRVGKKSMMYIWPYFAKADLTKLQKHQKIGLFRTAPASEAQKMLTSGRYNYYALGIGEDGTWHYFRKDNP